VTGVQTCALPISRWPRGGRATSSTRCKVRGSRAFDDRSGHTLGGVQVRRSCAGGDDARRIVRIWRVGSWWNARACVAGARTRSVCLRRPLMIIRRVPFGSLVQFLSLRRMVPVVEPLLRVSIVLANGRAGGTFDGWVASLVCASRRAVGDECAGCCDLRMWR